MYFNLVVTDNHEEKFVAAIKCESIPNKGDKVELIRADKTVSGYKVTDIKRQYIECSDGNWNTFITVYTMKYY